MQNRFIKRLLYLVLAFAVLLSVLPGGVLAAVEPAPDWAEPIIGGMPDQTELEFEARQRDRQPPGTTPRPKDEDQPKRGTKSSLDPEAVAISDEIFNNFKQNSPDMYLWTDGFYLETRYLQEEQVDLPYTEAMRDSLVSLAQQITADCETDAERIETIARWMAQNICYDYDYFTHETKGYPDIDPYMVIQNRYTVCAGYAQTCEYFLQSLGIPCVYIVTEDHAYNFAYDGTRWVIFDSTWMSLSYYEYGTLNLSSLVNMEWFDVSYDSSIKTELHHLIKEAPFTLYSGKLAKYPKYTTYTSVNIGSDVTEIVDWAFHASSVRTVLIGDSVKSIGYAAFYNCSDLTTLRIGNGVESLSEFAFSTCPAITDLWIGDGLKSIGNMFNGNESLTTLWIGDGVESLDDYAFYGCSNLSTLRIGNSVESIGYCAFYNCSGITSVTLPDSLKTIGDSAFQGCVSLTDLWIGNGIESIGDWAFGSVSILSVLRIGNGLKSVGYAAFYSCQNLTTVIFAGTEEEWSSISFGDFNEPLTSALISFGEFAIITEQPTDVSVAAGETATFNVVATGAESYQWYYRTSSAGSWAAVTATSGKTSAYSLTAQARHNGYQYYCKVTNSSGSVDSNIVTLTVGSKPVITTQPASKTVDAGSTATFKVVSTGATSYQWYYRTSSTGSWTKVSAASGKTSTYSLTAQERHNGYQYRCKVTNGIGSVYTDTVTLTVNSKPVITTQPTDKTVDTGSTVQFKVVATGAESYQWYYRTSSSGSWTTVSASSGKTSTYSLTAAARHNGYQYYCKVTNASGSVDSAVATLTVSGKPVITTQPTSKTVDAGSTAKFKVVATGATSYQWYYRTSSTGSWTEVSAASGKTSTYSLTAQERHNGYQYRCKVTNSIGSVYTDTVTLTVNGKPVITTQPTSKTVTAGSKATFKVVATGATSYQWYYRTSSAGSWTAVTAASGKTSTYSLTAAARHNGYQYRCEVKNEKGSVYTNIVTLTVE